jgi:hypothetical protein
VAIGAVGRIRAVQISGGLVCLGRAMRLKLASIALRQSFLYIVISSACTKYG